MLEAQDGLQLAPRRADGNARRCWFAAQHAACSCTCPSMFWRLEQHALLVKAGADLPVAILDPLHGQHAVLVVLEEHTHSSCCWFMPMRAQCAASA